MSERSARLLPLLALCVAGACSENGSEPEDAWAALPKYTDQFPPLCAPLDELMEAVQQSKTCASDADCTFLAACLEVREDCSGGFYVRADHDASAMQGLIAEAQACPRTSPCCTATPASARCTGGRCARAGDASETEACVAAVGATSECSSCLCTAMSSEPSECATEPSCAAIFQCAVAAGCFGTLACDLAESTFPCRQVVDAAGGPNGAAATLFRNSNAAAARTGCHVACAKSD